MEHLKIDLKPYLIEAKKYTNKEVFGVFLFGSQNYGLGDSDSDIDVNCLVLPDNPEADFMSPQEVILHNGERIEYMDIRSFLLSLSAGELNSLETLTTSFYVVNEKYAIIWEKLRENANLFAYANPENTFKGIQYHITSNFLRFFAKNAHETELEKYGYAPKQASHVVRGYEMLCRYNKQEDIYDIFHTKIDDFLFSIKRGALTEPMVLAIVKDYLKKIDAFSLQIQTNDLKKENAKKLALAATAKIFEVR